MLLLLLLLLPVQAKVQADYNLPNTSVITDGMGNVAATLPKMWVCTLLMRAAWVCTSHGDGTPTSYACTATYVCWCGCCAGEFASPVTPALLVDFLQLPTRAPFLQHAFDTRTAIAQPRVRLPWLVWQRVVLAHV